jgi:hypothetical protein
MEWDRKEIREMIEANIDWWWEEMEFAKTLLGIVQRTPTKEAFMSAAMSEAKKHYDPWIRDELCSFIHHLGCYLEI